MTDHICTRQKKQSSCRILRPLHTEPSGPVHYCWHDEQRLLRGTLPLRHQLDRDVLANKILGKRRNYQYGVRISKELWMKVQQSFVIEEFRLSKILFQFSVLWVSSSTELLVSSARTAAKFPSTKDLFTGFIIGSWNKLMGGVHSRVAIEKVSDQIPRKITSRTSWTNPS